MHSISGRHDDPIASFVGVKARIERVQMMLQTQDVTIRSRTIIG